MSSLKSLVNQVTKTATTLREVTENVAKLTSKQVGDLTKKQIRDAARVRFKKDYEAQEGMGLDPITGRNVGPASDVDKGKAGKVTRSPEPGFLQQQRTAGSRAKAEEKAELAKKVRDGTATKAEKDRLARLRAQDEVDTARATAKSAATRTKRNVDLPPLKSLPKPSPASNKPAISKDGVINEAVFDKLTPGQQKAQIRNAIARVEGPRQRELKALLDELAPTQAGETGVRRRRQGSTYGMSGAESKIKNIDEGVSKGRGGLDFNKGGRVTKRATGSHDYRMNKGGLLLSSVDNRKKK